MVSSPSDNNVAVVKNPTVKRLLEYQLAYLESDATQSHDSFHQQTTRLEETNLAPPPNKKKRVDGNDDDSRLSVLVAEPMVNVSKQSTTAPEHHGIGAASDVRLQQEPPAATESISSNGGISMNGHVSKEPATDKNKNGNDIGSRVYAEKNATEWAWATITSIRQSKDFAALEYSLKFDDGSVTKSVSRKHFVTRREYQEANSGGGDSPSDQAANAKRLSGRQQHSTKKNKKKQKEEKQEKPPQSVPKAGTTTTKDHFLVGRKVYFAWNDLDGNHQQIFGQVTECDKDAQDGDIITFTVEYSDSCCPENESNGSKALAVAAPQKLPPPLVVGGCIQYEERTSVSKTSVLLNDIGHLIHFWSWITPDSRHEEQVVTENGDGTTKSLPRLTLRVRGFRLELNVRQSTIPNAGYGVFVKCTPVEDKYTEQQQSRPFRLKAGELIDIGVYAPFSHHDKKLESVFFAKNFVFDHKCQEWAFGAGDARFDITDDVTGDIHAEARSHIPAYVNESNDDAAICIRAEHSPDSSVHYLLGHAYKHQGDFVLPSNGSEVEVFVNYGDGYEEVRVRKGYSFLQDNDERKVHLLNVIANEDVMDVKEMDIFDLIDIQACISFFSNVFSRNDKSRDSFTSKLIQRALTCVVVLHRRLWRFFLEENSLDDGSAGSSAEVNVKLVQQLASASVIDVLLHMMGSDEGEFLKALHSAGDVDGLFHEVMKKLFSGDEMWKLKQAGVME